MKRLSYTKSPWPKWPRVRPWLWPVPHGNGKERVFLSFYDAPEIVIAVDIDTALPLDLDTDERCKERAEGAPMRSFRDLLDGIYDHIEHDSDFHIPVPRPRIKELKQEWSGEEDDPFQDEDYDENEVAWRLIIDGGGTWCYAAKPPRQTTRNP